MPLNFADNKVISRQPGALGFKFFAKPISILLKENPVKFDAKCPLVGEKWPIVVEIPDPNPITDLEAEIMELVLSNRSIMGMEALTDGEMYGSFKPLIKDYRGVKQFIFKADPIKTALLRISSPGDRPQPSSLDTIVRGERVSGSVEAVGVWRTEEGWGVSFSAKELTVAN